MLQFLFSILAGAVTVAGPCILPLLPIILGTSTVKQHPLRPLSVIAGFIGSFTFFAILLGVFGASLGINPERFRTIAAVMIGLFGVVMLFPKIQERLFGVLQPLLQKITPRTDLTTHTLAGGFVLGASLGLVWTPCAGPILGSILTLVAAKQDLSQAGVLLFGYALGAGLPLLGIAYGGIAATNRVRIITKHAGAIQRAFGAVIILIALGLFTGYDRTVQTWLVVNTPWSELESRLTLLQPKTASLPIYEARLPQFVGITRWWNTPDGQPLTPEALNGKVVLVDFWTYSCINCIRTYPFLRSMHEKYADKGLVIVGVHTPEFAFEADPKNVEREIRKNNLMHPIALDPKYQTWNAFRNRYWPAEYFFDRQGRLRHTHFGEGSYEESERVIRELLEENGVELGSKGETDLLTPDFGKIKTPETYFGLLRGEEFMGKPGALDQDVSLTPARDVLPNRWTAGGRWSFHEEYVEVRSPDAVFRFNVHASQLHLVLESSDGEDKRIEIFVDGIKHKDLTINASQLYDIANFPDAGRHTVEIRIPDPDIRFYAATFS